MRGRNDIDATHAILNSRWIPEKSDAGKAYLSLRTSFITNVTVGADYRPLTGDVGFLATWRVRPETDRRPALILGTSHDDFVEDGKEVDSQTAYATISKYAFSIGPVGTSPYLGGVWIAELDETRPLGGANFRWKDWSALVQYSGTDTHLTIGRDLHRLRLSYVYWGFKYHGVAGTLRF